MGSNDEFCMGAAMKSCAAVLNTLNRRQETALSGLAGKFLRRPHLNVAVSLQANRPIKLRGNENAMEFPRWVISVEETGDQRNEYNQHEGEVYYLRTGTRKSYEYCYTPFSSVTGLFYEMIL